MRYVLSGPAVAIFDRKIPSRPISPATEKIDFILCGSGLTGKELAFVRVAHGARVFSAVWLDHWKNYAARFQTDEGLLLPDQVWVTDRWAADLALDELPGADIHIKGNPYLEDIVAEIEKLPHGGDGMEHVLYVHEPNRRNAYKRWIRNGFKKGQILRERPHPSMGVAERTLAEDVAWADVVVGNDSMALVVALAARRRVVSVLPKREELTIPYPGIRRLYG